MSSSNIDQVQTDKKTWPWPHKPGGNWLRLRCRIKPLHEAAIEEIEQGTGPADVWFVCSEGKVLGAHKIILAISSKFFATVMQDQNTTDDTVIHVPDVPVETMQIILSLMYRDNVVASSDVLKDIGDYMALFGMRFNKFIVEEAKENAQPVLNRVYDHIPSSNKTTKEDQLQEDVSRNNGVVPAATRKSSGLQAIVPLVPPSTTPSAPAQPLQLVNNGGKFYIMESSQDPKMPAQLNLLDPQPIFNPESVTLLAKSPVLENNLAIGRNPKRPRSILKPIESCGTGQETSSTKAMITPNRMPFTASELMKRKAEETVQREIDDGPPVLERMTYTDKENAMEDLVAGSSESLLANSGRISTSQTTPKLMDAGCAGSEMPWLRTPDQAKKSKCPTCGLTFPTMGQLKWHIDRHISPGVFKCPKCPQAFDSARAVHNHETSHNQTREKLITSLQRPVAAAERVLKYPDPGRPGKFIRFCGECGKWTQYHNYLYHLRSGHSTEVYFCDRCYNKVFPTKNDLMEHDFGCNG